MIGPRLEELVLELLPELFRPGGDTVIVWGGDDEVIVTKVKETWPFESVL